MNIFILDRDPQKCAEYHCDKHVVKMIVETAQILCTARFLMWDKNTSYKPTHKWHPCVLRVCESVANYYWLCWLWLNLLYEYEKRYWKHHRTQEVINECISNIPKYSNIEIWVSDFVLCMPDQYKWRDPVESYRRYYKAEKLHFCKWKNWSPFRIQ